MTFAALIGMAERLPTPDAFVRFGIRTLVGRTRARLEADGDSREAEFVAGMGRFPIAAHTDDANAQHYEVPAEFFRLVLGPQRKYSCCLFDGPSAALADAETRALEHTVANAGLADGMRILELGCGWGSLSMFMAARFSRATIISVSNSRSQRAAIEALAAERGLRNLTVITADMNTFAPEGRFDRIVSVEMFEHMSNWAALLRRCRTWLNEDGRLFLHVFTHRRASYRFDRADKADWIAQHFFTGGVMPSQTLPQRFPELFDVEEEWRWSGAHYALTARRWLENFDASDAAIESVLRPVYGADTALWKRRWRWFFLATEGLFGHAGGDVWGVGHFRMRPIR
ncbi:MAG: cyclopropane-fatty-acyl-phospholipid synthase family protein [Rhodoblastus sp.]